MMPYDDDRDDLEEDDNNCGFFDVSWAMNSDDADDVDDDDPLSNYGPIVDRCGACGMFVLVQTVYDLRMAMNEHEREHHGETFPERVIEDEPDYR